MEEKELVKGTFKKMNIPAVICLVLAIVLAITLGQPFEQGFHTTQYESLKKSSMMCSNSSEIPFVYSSTSVCNDCLT